MLKGGFVIKGRWIVNSLFDIRLEMSQQSLNGPCGGITQGTDGLSLDLSGDFFQHWDFSLVGVALFHADQDIFQPGRSLAAGCALSARFVLVKVRETTNRRHHIDGIIKHGHGSRPQTGPLGTQVIEFHESFVAQGLVQDGDGRSTGDACLDRVPSVAHSTAMFFDQFAEWDRHGFFDDLWIFDVTGNAKEFRPAVVFVSKGCKPGGTPTQNGWRDGDGFDVGDGGWTSKETDPGGEGWFETRLSLSSLQGFDQRRFFAANVGSCTAMQKDIKVVSATAGVLSDQSCVVCLMDGFVQDDGLVEVFSTNVNVRRPCPHGVSGEQTAFHEFVWVLAHDFSVLTGSRFAFIGIDDEKGRTAVGFLGHEGPLETGGESCSATSAQSAVLDFLDDPIGAHPHDFLGHVIIATAQGILQTPILFSVQVGEYPVLVGKTAVDASSYKDIGTRRRRQGSRRSLVEGLGYYPSTCRS
mmetsp:Transcript_10680/g.18814  ORF Transcript_10680/g.18814 Transcript_10680/m.18814 type:complete len:468 (-) Transcript_10680:308-1711(-)